MKTFPFASIQSKVALVAISFFIGISQLVVPAANAALTGWAVTGSVDSFKSNPPTWTVTVSTTDPASPLTAGDTANFIIEDSLGQQVGFATQDISTDTTKLVFLVELDPAVASADISDTDFSGTLMVSHPVDDDEIFDFPLSRVAQSANWGLSSSKVTSSANGLIWTIQFTGSNSDSVLNTGDTAELFVSDAESNQLVDETVSVSKDGTNSVKFQISIDPAALTPGWSENPLDGMLILQTTSGDQQVVQLPVPISGLPARPTTAEEYITSSSDYSTKPYIFQPTTCSDVPVSAQLNDPYHEITNVLFLLTDAAGNPVSQSVSDVITGATVSTSLYICPDDLKGLTSPFNLTLGLTFDPADRDYSEVSSPFTWKVYVKPVIAAKVVKITCVRAKPYSKLITSKAKCPTGYKKK